jgi:hypothetical protein
MEAGTKVRRAMGSSTTTGSVNVEEILADANKFKGAKLLTAKEKAWITGIDGRGYLTWSPNAGELMRDENNKEQLIPEYVHCNPYTGRIYEQAEAVF